MSIRRLASLSTMAILISIFVLMSHATTAPRTERLNGQVHSLNFSKAVPDQLNYQGFLADAADSSAVTGTLEMTFRLFDSETKGAELWSETHTTVEISNGLFQVLLGSETAFPANLFDGSTLWLQTEVGAEVLTPRKPLVSMAYSQRTNNADHATTAEYATDSQHAVLADTAGYCPGISAWTVDGDDVYRAIGDVGIRTATPNYPLDVNGIAATKGLWLPGAFGPDTAYVGHDGNWIAFGHPGHSEDFLGYKGNTFYFMDSPDGADITDPDVIIGGDVGIGTTSPAYPLDVNGAVNATTYWGDGSNLTGIAVVPDGDWTISGSDMYSAVPGNVGIGTFSPGAPLEVGYDNASSTTPAIVINNSNLSGQSALDFQFGGTPDVRLRIAATGGFHIGTLSGADLNLRTNDEQRLHITGDGKVGIGTGSPTTLLDVNGAVHSDSLSLGSAAKAGMNGHLRMHKSGSINPMLIAEDYVGSGGRIDLFDETGAWTLRLEPDVDGTGGFFEVERGAGIPGFWIDGNNGGSEEPWVSINGSARSVNFHMGNSGDASVILPDDAVSASEIEDEPGASNSLGPGYYALDGGNIDYAIDTVAITIPGPGFVEVTGGCYLVMDHSVGIDTRVFVAIDKIPANASYTFPGAQVASVPGVIPSSDWGYPCTTTRFYEEVSGGTKIYYLNVDYDSGTSASTMTNRIYLRAKYYPTLYGTVTLAETDGMGDALTDTGESWDGSTRGSEPKRRSITMDDHNARVAAEMAALRDEVKALREEVQNQRR